MYKAIISDIDGTLAPLTVHSVVSQTVKEAIYSLQSKNIVFCLATGKPFSMIEHLIDDLRLESPIITDNGAAIFHSKTHTCLWKSWLDEKTSQDILTYIRKLHLSARCSDGYTGFDVEDAIPTHTKFTKFMPRNFTKDQADMCVMELRQSFPHCAVHKTSSHKGPEYFDIYITNAEATKDHAVKKVAELLGISTDEIIGIGDQYNDIPLLEACGLKVAMGNAVDDLKRIADYVAPSVDEDGVAAVIHKFCDM